MSNTEYEEECREQSGNVMEFHVVWRVVDLEVIIIIIMLCRCMCVMDSPALQTQQAMRCCDVIHYVAAPVDVDSHFWRILLLCSWYSLTQNEISLFVAVITALKFNRHSFSIRAK